MGKAREWAQIQPDGDAHSLSTLVAEYIAWMEVRAYSPRSIRARKSLLCRFVTWCKERGLRRPTEITKPVLERYQRWLFYYRHHDGKVLSVKNQTHHLLTVKGWFRWLAKENLVLSNPASDLELPRGEHTLPRNVLSVEEVEEVMKQADLETVQGMRDRAMLEVLYATGMRRMEVVNLTIYDVDEGRGTVHIRLGKGKRDRVVPIGGRALSWVRKYLEDARPRLAVDAGNTTLFLSSEGERLNESTLSWLVGRYIKSSGINKTGSCHVFSHTMATLMLENGADLRYIQVMLGHAHVSTTEVYTRVSIEKLKEVYRATHPGAEERSSSSSAAAVDQPKP